MFKITDGTAASEASGLSTYVVESNISADSVPVYDVKKKRHYSLLVRMLLTQGMRVQKENLKIISLSRRSPTYLSWSRNLLASRMI
jgi:hypothetical protein